MDTVAVSADGTRRLARIRLAASPLLCVAVHLLAVFLVTTFSRADNYLAELDVSVGPWIAVVVLPELVLAAGAGLAATSAGRQPSLMRMTIGAAYLSIALVVAWAVSSPDRSEQLVWLFETVFGTS